MVFTGVAQNPEGPVMAGLDVVVLQDGRQVNFANEVSLDVDHMQEPINVLGVHAPLDHKSLGYGANITTNTFLLLGENVDGAIFFPGFQPDGSNNINIAGSFDLTLADVYSGTVLRSALKAKINTEALSAPNRGLLTSNLSWVCARVIPGVQTS